VLAPRTAASRIIEGAAIMATSRKTIETEGLAKAIDSDINLHVWNVLNDDYFKGEMIPGSRRVPLAELTRTLAASTLPKDAPVVVYCAGPHCPASREAAEAMTALGYTNVSAFEGGLDDWKQQGHGVVGTGTIDTQSDTQTVPQTDAQR
jgi:rhodanese-related sulfurtransferase